MKSKKLTVIDDGNETTFFNEGFKHYEKIGIGVYLIVDGIVAHLTNDLKINRFTPEIALASIKPRSKKGKSK